MTARSQSCTDASILQINTEKTTFRVLFRVLSTYVTICHSVASFRLFRIQFLTCNFAAEADSFRLAVKSSRAVRMQGEAQFDDRKIHVQANIASCVLGRPK